MKLLYYSSDSAEVDRVRREFLNAAIPCEVREGSALDAKSQPVAQAELWIKDDGDYYRAVMLCIHLGVGFGKRAPRRPRPDDEQFDLPLD